MEKPKKIQRGLKDVSHLFLSSLESEDGRIPLSDISPACQQQFLKRCKFHAALVLDPALERQEFSFHSRLCSTYVEDFERLWFIVENPSETVWNELGSRYTLPPYQELKDAACRVYSLSPKLQLVVLSAEYFKQLVSFQRIREKEVLAETEPELFWFVLSQKSPQSFLDFVPLLDELVFVTSPHVEEFSQAYKTMKASLFITPDVCFSVLLNAKLQDERKGEMRQLFDRELNQIAARYLHLRVPVVGPVEGDELLRKGEGTAPLQELFSFYRVQNWKRWKEKMMFVSHLFDFKQGANNGT